MKNTKTAVIIAALAGIEPMAQASYHPVHMHLEKNYGNDGGEINWDADPEDTEATYGDDNPAYIRTSGTNPYIRPNVLFTYNEYLSDFDTMWDLSYYPS